jgi:N-acetyl sugar amidotransferase
MLRRCKTCVMPDSRPDTPFIDGECAACVSYRRRPQIDWENRKSALVALLDRHDGRCIVPSSGGKDSTYQVMTLLELGADVTVVTARTCQLTPIGRANIDNLARHARTIEVVPNMRVRAKLNRLGLEMVGDISWPEHAAIFTTPFRVAAQLGIPLLFYGENPQDQYGGPVGSEEAMQLTMRWRSEFGGFLGLRPDDFVGIEGITERDMADYKVNQFAALAQVEAHFLGQYLPWDSRRNADVARAAGMAIPDQPPTSSNWWRAENLDNAQTGIHDYFMWLKYGFGRGCQQISVDVRAGLVTRDHAMAWIDACEGAFPHWYGETPFREVIQRIDMQPEAFQRCVNRFRNEAVHAG